MPQTIQLFITCILDTLYPQVGRDIVQVLNRLGVQVALPPGQTCCGQPAFNAGLRALARPVAMRAIDLFEKTSGPIVVPSGSCTAMIRHGYPELFADDPAWLRRARSLGERTYEFSEFLVDYLGVIDLGARFSGKISYHSSCHLYRGLGIDRQPRLLLDAVRDAEFIELPATDDCCGFGGVFSVEHPEISSAMLERKIANIESTAAPGDRSGQIDRDQPLVVSCDLGCITNINGGLHRRGLPARAVYIAEVLARQ
jgi:L-lactate dehydrogenase complex protein LldE